MRKFLASAALATSILVAAAPAAGAMTGGNAIRATSNMDRMFYKVSDKYEHAQGLYGISHSTEKGLATAACEVLDEGGSEADILASIVENVHGAKRQKVAAFIVGAGVRAYCPQHADELQ